MSNEQEFLSAIASAGLTAPDVAEADGRLHRFSSSGKRSDTAGWYVLHGEVGAFGDFRSGLTETWHSKTMQKAAPEKKRELMAKLEAAKKQREEEKKQDQKQAEERANLIWDAALPCDDHPYLQAKGVKSHGLRVGRWQKIDQETGEVYLDVPDALLVPIKSGKRIVSLQAVYPTKISGRNKDFLKGGQLAGCYFTIGKPDADPSNEHPIYITEGYATGATIHEITGCAVVVCFSAGNIRAVVEKIKGAFGRHNLVIAADNDEYATAPVNNPGLTAANEAGKLLRAHVVYPVFTEDQKANKPTDFNDLAALAGPEECGRQLMGFLQSAEPPISDNLSPKLSDAEEIEQKTEIETVEPTKPPAKKSKIIDTMTPLPDTTEKGKPISTIENLAEICGRLGVCVRYNVVSKDDEILIPGEQFSLDNGDNASLAWLESWCARFGMPSQNIGGYLSYLADKNQYSPVAAWVLSNTWDGVSRIDEFMETVKSDNEPLKYILMRRWMISAVAAAFSPSGISAQGVLVFQGPQNLGKTKWFKTLVPKEIGVIQDGVTLDPKDKDSVKQAVSNWLVELGEVDATFRKSDIAQLKSFLTRDKDVLRRAYARKESKYPRRTVFFASVNPEFFLADPTGNKRYWTIKCLALDHSHKIDMQQVWAEFYEIYKTGESWYLTPDELDELNESNEGHETHDPITERIQTRLHWDDPESLWVWSTVTDVLYRCGFDRPTQADTSKAGIFLKKNPKVLSKRTSMGRLVLAPKEKIRGE